MAWSRANTGAGGIGGNPGPARPHRTQAAARLRTLGRRGLRRARRAAAVAAAGSLLGSGLTPVAVVTGGAAAVTAAAIVATHAPARASISGSVLILSTSVNGGTSSAEAQAASALGLSVTVATPSTWDAMTKAQFQAYTAIIIGDPSTSSCSSTVPSDALSTAGTWGGAVNGNASVLGTAPALAGGTTLISDAIAYAASGGSGKTGLYASLNCEYSTASAGTSVPLLASVEDGGFTVTGQGSHCPSAAGTVNTWQALALAQFNGLTSGKLGPWSSPACSVEETFNAWPSGLAGLAYYTGASPATFTASDGATGQAYIVAGAPVSTATAALAPSTGGQVPAGATAGGGTNPAAPGVSQATAADPVNTENGDFTQSATDLSIPTFGPSLDFTRDYDAQAAQQQTQTATPGSMGYGWTDNWASSLAVSKPVPGDVYNLAGTASSQGNGGPAVQAPLDSPVGVLVQPGTSNVYVADSAANRIQEIPGTSGTQWGISMTAGDVYTIAGSATGSAGSTGDGGPATSALLSQPEGLAMDSSGNLYIADTNNNRIQELAKASGTQWGTISMTANHIYTVAGSSAGSSGHSGNGGVATSALLNFPQGVSVSSAGDLYIADSSNNRIQEVAKATGTQWNSISMTANDIYTVAGSATGTSGDSGNGVVDTSSLLHYPSAVVSGSGSHLYIADSANNRIVEVARTTHTQWGTSMTANDTYTIAGNVNSNSGFSGDGGPATSALMDYPLGISLDGSGNLYVSDNLNNRSREVSASTASISTIAGTGGTIFTAGDGGPALSAAIQHAKGVAADPAGDIYLADSGNNRIQEIAATSHTQFGIVMTAGSIYTIAGSADGHVGSSGDSGSATSALLNTPCGVAADAAGDVYIADTYNNRIQEVAAASGTQWGQSMTSGHIYTVAGSSTGTSGHSGDGGPAGSALLYIPGGVATDAAGDVYIADNYNNRIQEMFASGGQTFGQSMTAGDIYTIAGSSTGTSGLSGDGGPGTSALLSAPTGISSGPGGNLYIGDSANNRVQELAAASGTQWGQSMTAGDIYTIAGNAAGTYGFSGDGGPATAAYMSSPQAVAADASGDVYITDTYNNRIQEVAATNGTQWSQPMTAGDIYTVAGDGTQWGEGSSGNGGPATAALLNNPAGVAADPSGNVHIADTGNNQIREVNATTSLVFPESPTAGGITITQPGGAQITFYPQTGGQCASPYVLAGQYCTLPENVGASLTYSSGTYTFTQQPGTTYTYNSGGNLTSMTDSAGNTLSIAYGTPLPGSGNCPASANWCQTITAANGRALTIGYNSANLATSVTDPMGRQWSYGYTSSDLTSVTDPKGNLTTYTYGPGSGGPLLANDLLTITNPNAQPGGPDAGGATVNVYDTLGRVTSQTDPMGYKTTFGYSQMNTATGTGAVTVNDPDGNSTVYDYSQGTLAAQSAWTGTTLTSEQDNVPAQSGTGTSAGTQLDVASADADGNITTTTYDVNGNPVNSTAPDGVGSQFATTTQQSTSLDQPDCASDATAASTCSQSAGPSPVAPGGTVTPPSSIPPQGVTWTLYDTDGNQLWTTTGVYPPGSNTASYARTTYQLFKNNSITLNGNNISCTATPPSASLPCATINADGVVTQLAYNSSGDLTSSSTPDGNGSEVAKTTYSYDGNGEQTATTSPDGNLSGANAGNYTTTTAYNNDGQKTSETQAGGTGATVTPRTTTYGYDSDGNQTTVQDARSYTTTTTFNADDQSTLVTDPDGNATLTCYDGAGNTTQTVPPVGVAANNLTPSSCPSNYPSGYGNRLASDATTDTYDANGNQTQETTPAPAGQTGSETTTYTYDPNGNLTKTTAPPTSNSGPNQVTADTYTSTGNVATETTGSGTSAVSTISYCYDPNGNQTSVVYPDGNTSGTAACETSSPWVVSSNAYPSQAAYQSSSSYDSANERITTTTPATAAASSGATTTYTYDPAGNKLTSTDPNGVTTTRIYTPLNAPTTINYSGSSAHAVTYAHDANGSRTGMTDATGTSSYTYDPFGELTSDTNGAGQTVSYGYNADGKATGVTYPLPASASWAASSTVNYGYDHADLLSSVTDFNGHQITISDNADGLPLSETLGTTGNSLTTGYDSTERPTVIALKNGGSTLESFAYSYSASGDVLTETDTPASSTSPATYTYDPQGRVTSMTPGSSGNLSYSFDASSNPTTIPTGASAGFDKADELTSSTLSGQTTNYAYNADGQRLTAKQGSTTTTSATWNGADRLTAYSGSAANMSNATYDGDGLRASTTITPSGGSATTQGYVWNTTQAIPPMIMDSSNAYVYGTGMAPAEQVNLSTGAITYLVADIVGSARGTVNASGSLTGTANYDAWGNPETPGGLSAITPFGFGDGYTDATGMLYFINRYYDPTTAQFISTDPIAGQTHQPYQYGSDNPVANSDPDGLLWWGFGSHQCRFQLQQPHWSDSVKGAIKVNGGVYNCTAKPYYAWVRLRLWKVGSAYSYLEAAYAVDSNEKPFTRYSGNRWHMLNQGCWRRCGAFNVYSYFYSSILAEATDRNGHRYHTKDWPDDTWDTYVVVKKCYTRN